VAVQLCVWRAWLVLTVCTEADHIALQARKARQTGDMSTSRTEQVRKYEEAAALYDKAAALYQLALGSKPDEDVALRNWANILTGIDCSHMFSETISPCLSLAVHPSLSIPPCLRLRAYAYVLPWFL
jgi:hypothetical protein